MTTPPDARLRQARAIARLLDTAIPIPGTSMRLGIDPLLGLVPGLGDVAGAAMSGYVVLTAVRLGAPRFLVARMVGNVALDTLVGTVPLLGDLFDAGWKANTRNVALLDRHLERQGAIPGERRSTVLTALVLLAISAAGIALTFFVLKWLYDYARAGT